MGLFTNPVGYAGYPPNSTTATTVNSTVRAATAAEAAAGTLTTAYISPATAQSATALDFASPPVTGYGSTTPRPVAATTITATTTIAATTTVTAGTGITSTTGNIVATAGNVTAGAAVSATTTVTAGTDLISTAGNLLLQGAAKQIRIEGGAVTDFVGTATLVAGTVTVANTNIAAADEIFVTRESVNGSTALGVFDTSITPATSFTITARNPTDALTQTNDTSIVKYVIIRQL